MKIQVHMAGMSNKSGEQIPVLMIHINIGELDEMLDEVFSADGVTCGDIFKLGGVWYLIRSDGNTELTDEKAERYLNLPWEERFDEYFDLTIKVS